MATILPFNFPPSPRTLKQAVACVQDGGVLAVPTDSYYALAVGAFQPATLEKLQAIKGDRGSKPFPVLIGDLSQLDQLVDDVPEIAKKLMQHFWPGLLTLVLKGNAHLPLMLKSEQGMIGVRQPNDLRVCELLKQTGPLTGTSANRSGQSSAQSVEEVIQQVGSEIDLILNSGQTPGGQPSTVLQVVPDLRILREGAIAHVNLQKFLAGEGKILS